MSVIAAEYLSGEKRSSLCPKGTEVGFYYTKLTNRLWAATLLSSEP